MKILRKLKHIFYVYGHHALFGLSVISLAALGTWWAIFLNQSVHRHRELKEMNLETLLAFHAVNIQHSTSTLPELGSFKHDVRLEISHHSGANIRFSKSLAPRWPELNIGVKREIVEKIHKEFLQKRFMVWGESGFLLLLILLSVLFLYKYVQMAKKTANELREFWRRMTHEIKTPITGIKAFLQSLQNKSLKNDQMEPYLEMALKQVDVHEQMANNILAGSTFIKGKKQSLRMTDIDIREQMEKYFKNHIIGATGTTIKISNNRENIRVRGDNQAIKVILDNIVNNALKYVSHPLSLDISINRKENRGIISITDNGNGIPPGMEETIFHAYRHLSSGELNKKHGSGLGLYISRELAREMGGELKAQLSGSPAGLTIQLYLNLVKGT